MREIPLKVLIVDPDSSAAEALQNAFRDIKIVLSVKHVYSLDKMISAITSEDINTIFIDPVSLGVDKISCNIFRIRKTNSGIVFVLYYDSKKKKRKRTFFLLRRKRKIPSLLLSRQNDTRNGIHE